MDQVNRICHANKALEMCEGRRDELVQRGGTDNIYIKHTHPLVLVYILKLKTFDLVLKCLDLIVINSL